MPNGSTKKEQYSSANGARSSYEFSSTFTLGDFSVDEARPMKVVVIGAGYSGELQIVVEKTQVSLKSVRVTQASQQE